MNEEQEYDAKSVLLSGQDCVTSQPSLEGLKKTPETCICLGLHASSSD